MYEKENNKAAIKSSYLTKFHLSVLFTILSIPRNELILQVNETVDRFPTFLSFYFWLTNDLGIPSKIRWFDILG